MKPIQYYLKEVRYLYLCLNCQSYVVRKSLLTQLSLARIHSRVCHFSEDPLSNLAWVWICAKESLTTFVTYRFQLIRDVVDNFFNEVWHLTTTTSATFSIMSPSPLTLCFLCSYSFLWVNHLILSLIWPCSGLINLSHQPSFLNLLIKSSLLPPLSIMHGTF